MKTIVLTFAKQFMNGHPKKGEPTDFRKKIIKAQKIHTIRSNYDYWAPKMEEVIQGNARLSLRQWKGKPYRSKQDEFWEILQRYNPGYQKVTITNSGRVIINGSIRGGFQLASHDGLEYEDFINWFDLPFEGIIIHFTDFRY